jgi:hypothetical protein
MVTEIKNIVKRYPKVSKTDADILTAYLRENPDADLASLILRLSTPNLFDIELWNQADKVKTKYKKIVLEEAKVIYEAPKSKELKSEINLDQVQVIEEFLKKDIPKF